MKITRKDLEDLVYDFLCGYEYEFPESTSGKWKKKSDDYVDKFSKFLEDWLEENYEEEKK
jgi:hypothetical protein